MAESIIQLKCDCKNDPWGKRGANSLAARLCSKTPGTNFKIEDGQLYSEMWMGTYPRVPSYILSTGEPLQSYLKKHPELLGKSIVDRFGPDLPFLPKILSMDKALPLQIHPDKELAKQLHKRDPKRFGDTNHKPEIAVALSAFELFAGWKPLNDLTSLFRLKPLERFMPAPHMNFNDDILKQVAKALLDAPESVVAETTSELIQLPKSAFGIYTYIPSLLARLREQYSEVDNGNLTVVVCTNYMTLSPGDAIYIPADGMHAYLSGDIFECMARSDNVLNTGFCPRPQRDSVALFTDALSFWPHDPEEALLGRHQTEKGQNNKTIEYAPPISEFKVLATHLGAGEKETITGVGGPSIMIVTSGCGKLCITGKSALDLGEGYVFFIGQGTPVSFETERGMVVYRAYAE